MNHTIMTGFYQQLAQFNISKSQLKGLNEFYVNTHNTNMDDKDFVNSDEYNWDLGENIEDESLLPELPNIPTPGIYYHSRNFGYDLGRVPTDRPIETEESEESTGLSSDSLAFTITYCSVFTITLLYVAVKLVKRWKMRSISRVPTARQQMPWCGHAHCSQVHQSNGRIPQQPYLPYAGIGSAWIPGSMVRLAPPLPLPVHATATCNDGCDGCRRLAQPPPSYTKLFLEEQPPSYGDAVQKEEASEVIIEDTEVIVQDSVVIEIEDNETITKEEEDHVIVVVEGESEEEKDDGRQQS